MRQTLDLIGPTSKQPQTIKNLSSLAEFIDGQIGSYIYTVNAKPSLEGKKPKNQKVKKIDYGSKLAINLHRNERLLIVDKYIVSAIPEAQTCFALEACGCQPENYQAYLDGFWLHNCQDLTEEKTQEGEYVTPIINSIKGFKSYNPYIKFLNAKRSAGKTLSKLRDLPGFDLKKLIISNKLPFDPFDLYDFDRLREPVLGKFDLTFPNEISNLLFEEKHRDDVVKKAHKCFSRFFDKLQNRLGVPPGCQLGANGSLHPWSSSNPLLPHLHYHAIISNFYYQKITKNDRVNFEETDPELWSLYDQLYALIQTRQVAHGKGEYEKDFKLQPGEKQHLENIETKTEQYVSYEHLPEIIELQTKLAGFLLEKLGFGVLPWKWGKKEGETIEYPLFPFDDTLIKEVWTEAVNFYFPEVKKARAKTCTTKTLSRSSTGQHETYDVHISYSKFTQQDDRSQIYHYLVYKNRPPIVDLDLYFRGHKKLVEGPQKGDFQIHQFHEYIFDEMLTAKDSQDYTVKKNKYAQYRHLLQTYGKKSFESWLNYIVFGFPTHNNCRVRGFMANLKRYRVTSLVRGPLPEFKYCPICGGFDTEVIKLEDYSPDFLLINMNGYMLKCNLADRPPTLGGQT